MREPTAKAQRLAAEDLNATDKLELFVFGKSELNQAVLVARLDNLGKGAAGAAVQNIRLMLGSAMPPVSPLRSRRVSPRDRVKVQRRRRDDDGGAGLMRQAQPSGTPDTSVQIPISICPKMHASDERGRAHDALIVGRADQRHEVQSAQDRRRHTP